jgi:hypothetical protein
VVAASLELLSVGSRHAWVVQDAAMATADLIGVLVLVQGCLDGCIKADVVLRRLDLGIRRTGMFSPVEETIEPPLSPLEPVPLIANPVCVLLLRERGGLARRPWP